MDRIDRLAWPRICQQLDDEGLAVVPGLLGSNAALQAGRRFRDSGTGGGQTFKATLPQPFADCQAAFYRHLAPLANHWHQRLAARSSGEREPRAPARTLHGPFPPDLPGFQCLNREADQHHEQSCLTRLTIGEEIRLHQRADDAWVFPFQVVILLSNPEHDFEGGELVLVEQRPRMQSRPMVLSLQQGDAAILCASTRPVSGGRGDYAVRVRHGVSRLHAGQRLAVELTFHLSANR